MSKTKKEPVWPLVAIIAVILICVAWFVTIAEGWM